MYILANSIYIKTQPNIKVLVPLSSRFNSLQALAIKMFTFHFTHMSHISP